MVLLARCSSQTLSRSILGCCLTWVTHIGSPALCAPLAKRSLSLSRTKPPCALIHASADQSGSRRNTFAAADLAAAVSPR